MKYVLIALLVATSAFALNIAEVNVGDVTEHGTVIYNSGAVTGDTKAEVFNQWWTADWTSGIGSLWYNPAYDMKCAANFQVDGAYDGYVLSGFDVGFIYWYGSPNTSKGCWACLYTDSSNKPANTEPNEKGAGAGWHDDLEAGNGALNYDGITGLEFADYWAYADMTETPSGDGGHLVHADMGDAASGGLFWSMDSSTIYWFALQRYAIYPGSGPYGGVRDFNAYAVGNPTPGWMQIGVSGGSVWNPPSSSGDTAFILYGEPGDTTDPEIGNLFPADGATGIPLDTNITFNVTDDLSGCDTAATSYEVKADSTAVAVTGTFDATDPLDVAFTLDPDANFGSAAVVDVAVETYDNGGNGPISEDWSFTCLTGIKMATLGSIKANYR